MEISCNDTFFTRASAILLGLVLGLCMGPAFAVHDLGIFELDGNAIDDIGGAPNPDDWETLFNGGGTPTQFTGIINDEPDASGNDDSVFVGGRKDIQDLDQWAHKIGSSPDKDEIMNAYAAAYEHNGDTIINFGADRVSNKGDAFLGFWFFKRHVEALADGSFDGMHSNGDVLVLVNFPQASNASPETKVVVWDDSCNKAANNNPSPGQCDAKNIRLVFKDNAICGSAAGDLVCSITNDEGGPNDPTPSPWPFQSKNDNTANQFPYESFFEGGINLTQLIGGDSCFSSFVAETRSSKEFTATLKDFVLRDFELCSVDIVKQCDQGDVNASETAFVFPYSGTVTNDGAGTLHDVIVVDNQGTPADDTDDVTFDIGTLIKDATANFSGTIESLLNPPTNTATVYAAGTPGGELTITDTFSDQCEPVNRDPMISVTKACTTAVMSMDGKVVVGVNFMGQVCNDTGGTSGLDPIGLVNVTVTDDSGTTDTGDDVVVLGPIDLPADTCASYSGSYLPSSVSSSDPSIVDFSDTVTAIGTAVLGFGQVEESATATCPLCPPDSVCDLDVCVELFPGQCASP